MAEKKKTAPKNTSAQNKNAPASKGGSAKNTSKAGNNTAHKQSAAKNVPAKQQKKGVGIAPYIIALAALLITLLLFVEDMGFMSKSVRPLLFGLVGNASYAVPIYMLNIVFFWKVDRDRELGGAKLWLAFFSFLFISVILHHYTTSAELVDGVSERSFKADMWKLGVNGTGTGIFGGYAYALFDAILGKATMFLSWLFFIIILPFLFGTTPFKLIHKLYKSLKEATENMKTVDADDEDDVDGEEDELPPHPVTRKKPEVSSKPAHKKSFTFPDDEEGEGADEPLPLPTQIEINRTRRKPAAKDKLSEEAVRSFVTETNVAVPSEPDYKSIFVDDGVRAPEEFTSDPFADDKAEIDLTAEAENDVSAVNEPIEQPKEADRAEVVERVEEVPLEEEATYVFPPLGLLAESDSGGIGYSPVEIQKTSEKLVSTLADFGVRTRIINTSCGPAVTRYELQPESGVRVKSIANLADDIALHLAAKSIRLECPIPGKSAVGIEIPNKKVNIVRLRELIESETFVNNSSKLITCLGMDVAGNPIYLDIAKMPHLLIAGATGMGKSVCINSLIISLLYKATPDEVRLIMIDPKKVEFSDYNGIPHLLVPVVTEPKKAAGTLNWAVLEMEKRFSIIQEVGARDLKEYNEFTKNDPEKEYMPQVVIVIDELADLMMTAPDEVETSICRLAQKARAAGMHLIIGTQRPSVDVITGLIKSNIPSRIAFTVASQVDSRTILDIAGAEKLMGNGDMLYSPVGSMKPLRVQGAFVSSKEAASVCSYIKKAADVQYSEDVMEQIEKEAKLCGEKHGKHSSAADSDDGGEKSDPMELQAIEVALECGTISTSLLQRRLSLGYARAARIVDRLERKGLISNIDVSTKKRKVLISAEEFAEMKLNAADKEEE